MPDILKRVAFREREEAVYIPDLPEPPPEPPPEPVPEPDGEPGEPSAMEAPPPPTREELAALYADELDAVRREAAERAYSDALRQKRGEIREALAKVDDLLLELQEQQDDYIDQYTRELKSLAVEIAEKVMLQKIEDDDLVLAPLVLRAVSSVKHSRWLTVDLSERLVGLVNFLSEELKRPEYQGRAEVHPMACPDDTCRVNTDEGTVVATVTVQTRNLREAFANEDME